MYELHKQKCRRQGRKREVNYLNAIHTALVFIPALLGKAAWPDFHNNIYFL